MWCSLKAAVLTLANTVPEAYNEMIIENCPTDLLPHTLLIYSILHCSLIRASEREQIPKETFNSSSCFDASLPSHVSTFLWHIDLSAPLSMQLRSFFDKNFLSQNIHLLSGHPKILSAHHSLAYRSFFTCIPHPSILDDSKIYQFRPVFSLDPLDKIHSR